MNKVWLVHVITEASDEYNLVFRNEPSREYITKMIWEMEGDEEDLGFFTETLSIFIWEEEIIDN